MKVFHLTVTFVLFMILSSQAQTPEFSWVKTGTGPETQGGTDIKTDALGNSYVSGYFVNSMTLGDFELSEGNGGNMFLAKFDSGGTVLWVKQAQSTGGVNAYALAIDDSSNIYLTGSFTKSMMLDSITLNSASDMTDIYLAKFDSAGNAVWAKRFGGIFEDSGTDVEVDAEGIIFLTGNYRYTINFGDISLTSLAGSWDIFTAKLDADGNTIWAKSMGGADWDVARTLSPTPDGGCVTTARFTQNIKVDSLNFTGAGSNDIILVKYNVDGSLDWAQRFGGFSGDEPSQVVYNNNNIYLAGQFFEEIEFGNFTLNGNGLFDIFITKFDMMGNVLWSNHAGGPQHDYAEAIAIDKNENIVVTGWFSRETFFSNSDTSVTRNGPYIMRYDSDGDFHWVKTFGQVYDSSRRINIDSFGNYFVTGSYEGESFFDDFWLEPFEKRGMFLAKLTVPPETPKVALSIDNIVTANKDSIVVPINIDTDTFQDISAIEITLQGFQPELQFQGILTDSTLLGNTDWFIAAYAADSLLSLAFAGSESIQGKDILVKLLFSLSENIYDFIPLNISSAIFNTGDIPYFANSGGVRFEPIVNYGDINRNGMADIVDVSMLLDFLVGGITLDDFQLLNADVTQSGDVSALDAAFLMQYLFGIIEQLPFNKDLPSSYASIDMPEDDILISQSIQVPLSVTYTDSVFSFEGEISYDPMALEFENIFWSLPQDDFNYRARPEEGVLKIACAGKKTLAINGNIAILFFKPLNQPQTTVNIETWRWNESPIQQNVASAQIDIISSVQEGPALPQAFELMPNYPNPFNPTTIILYAVPRQADVKISIFNTLGEEVERLVDKESAPGYYSVEWNASNYSSGVYFYRMQSANFSSTQKAIIIK